MTSGDPTVVDAPMKAFYSPAEVAEIASLSRSTILNYIHDGRLNAVKLSERTCRIPRKAVLRLLGLEAPPVVLIERPDVRSDPRPSARAPRRFPPAGVLTA